MKKILLLTLLIATIITGKSQNQRFLKTYQVREGNQYDFINVIGATVSPMYPELIFITFEQLDYGESSNNHQGLMLVDTAGNLLKTISYTGGNIAAGTTNDFKQSVFIDNNGDIFLSGYVDGQGTWDGEGLIMKVDTNNNVWFAKKIGSWDGSGQYDDDFGITISKTLNLNANNPPLFVAGSVDQFAGSTTDKQIPFIAQINKTNGSVSKYLEIETNSSIPFALYDLPSGNISLWTREISPNTKDIRILLDSTLNLLSAPVSYTYANYTFAPNARTSVLTSDFNQVNAGFCQDTTGNYQIYAYSITSTGVINWAKVYSFDAGLLSTSLNGVMSIVEHDSSLYILADAAVSVYPYNDFILMKISKNTGNLIWVRSQATNYKGDASTYSMIAKTLLIKNNSLYIIGDYSKYGPDNSVFVIKSDLDGNWTNDCYDNRDYGNISVYDANIINTNLSFNGDITFAETVFAPQVQLFPDTTAEEVHPPQASAIVPGSICQSSVLTITDQSNYHYSWNYSYKNCGFWNNGSYSDLSPGTTDNSNTLYCSGNDSIIIYAYDVNDNWNNSALCIDSAIYTINIIPPGLNLGFIYSAIGNSIQFTDTTTGTVQWLWNFGDGNTDTIQNPLHTFQTAGTFNVCLTAYNACGDSATVCKNVNVTGITNVNVSNINVYPNPAKDKIIVISEKNEIKAIELRNISGKIIFSQKTTGNSIEINIENLPKGIYLLHIRSKNSTYFKKIVKQ